MSENQEVVDFLYSILGAVPDPEFGVINILPFAAEDEQTNALKRRVASGIATALADAGHLSRPQAEGPPQRSIRLQCRACSALLLTTVADHSGVANVAAANVIQALGSLKHECPHPVRTLEDQRRLIQEAVEEAQKNV